MPTGKTTALIRWAFINSVMSLLFNRLSGLVIAFLPRRKPLLISWLQSPPAVILEPEKKGQRTRQHIKSTDITFLTKVHIVKAMVFIVIIYRCESWTINRLSAKELMFSNFGTEEVITS